MNTVHARIVTRFAPQVADFMLDCYGRVEFDGKGQWVATDGGATFKVAFLSPDEAFAVDCAARKILDSDA